MIPLLWHVGGGTAEEAGGQYIIGSDMRQIIGSIILALVGWWKVGTGA